jgi:hypothetical protein
MNETLEFVPATFANRFHVVLNPVYTRITFADQTSQTKQEIAHTGIVLTTSDAVELANLILKTFEENKALYQTDSSRK